MQTTQIAISSAAEVLPPEEEAALEPLIDEINELKEERNAIVAAHNYMSPPIFHLASDIRGDSLALAEMALDTPAEVIVLAGVHFMAETAKIINPQKTVLIPDPEAGCSLADGITAEDVLNMRRQYPGVPVVTYVNTSAEVKAESDICCTSSNAVAVVESLGVDRVIFAPDQYLGKWVATQTDVDIILWEGSCMVHELFTGSEIDQFRDLVPELSVIAHPECPPDVLDKADFVGSTHGIANWVKEHQPDRVMMLTECSMADNVAELSPTTTFVRPCNLCPHMQKITLDNIRDALKYMQYEVYVSPEVAARAKQAVSAMIEVGRPS